MSLPIDKTISELYYEGTKATIGIQPSGTYTFTPTESSQSADVTNYATAEVGAVSSSYVGSSIPRQSTLSVSGKTITASSGYYANDTSASVSDGTAGTPYVTLQRQVSESGVITWAYSPSVENTTGYITGGKITGTGGSITASDCVSGNKSITASTSTQTSIDVTNYATVSVEPTPTETQTATTNGTITPTSGKYLSSVVVAIPEYDGSVS